MPTPPRGQPTIATPTPISAFSNTALRESIETALASIPDKNDKNVMLEISNKGGGVMVFKRFGDDWKAMAGVRYDRGSGAEVRVAVLGSWK